MRTDASLPKPVLTPYITSPRASAASTVRREAATPASADWATATAAPPRATATMSAMVRERPSRVMVGGIPKLTVAGCKTPSCKWLKEKEWPGQQSLATPPGNRRQLGARGLHRACDRPTRRVRDGKLAAELKLRVAGVGLETPIEDQVIAPDVRHAQRAVAHRLAL